MPDPRWEDIKYQIEYHDDEDDLHDEWVAQQIAAAEGKVEIYQLHQAEYWDDRETPEDEDWADLQERIARGWYDDVIYPERHVEADPRP